MGQVWSLSPDQRRERILQLASGTTTSPTGMKANAPPYHDDPAGPKEEHLQPDATTPSINRAARTLVLWEKEVSLARYHGFLEYMKIKRPFAMLSAAFTWKSSSALPAASPHGDASPLASAATESLEATSQTAPTVEPTAATILASPKVGQIAFMITASMRLELMNRLQYTSAEIKTLTPLEASLILQHDLAPPDRPVHLPRLLEQHANTMQQQRNEQLAAAAAADTALTSPPSGPSEPSIAMSSVTDQEPPLQLSVGDDGTTSSSLPTASDVSYSFLGTKWYQIVERKKSAETTDDETVVVAMYLHSHEAELGQETHQLFADRRAERAAAEKKQPLQPASVFEIRQVYIK
jgi:hypothetical protein